MPEKGSYNGRMEASLSFLKKYGRSNPLRAVDSLNRILLNAYTCVHNSKGIFLLDEIKNYKRCLLDRMNSNEAYSVARERIKELGFGVELIEGYNRSRLEVINEQEHILNNGFDRERKIKEMLGLVKIVNNLELGFFSGELYEVDSYRDLQGLELEIGNNYHCLYFRKPIITSACLC